jgi:hypothetical protein
MTSADVNGDDAGRGHRRGWLCGGWLCGAGRVCHTTHARATFTPSAIPGAYTASYTVHRLGRVTLWSRCRGVPTALVRRILPPATA